MSNWIRVARLLLWVEAAAGAVAAAVVIVDLIFGVGWWAMPAAAGLAAYAYAAVVAARRLRLFATRVGVLSLVLQTPFLAVGALAVAHRGGGTQACLQRDLTLSEQPDPAVAAQFSRVLGQVATVQTPAVGESDIGVWVSEQPIAALTETLVNRLTRAGFTVRVSNVQLSLGRTVLAQSGDGSVYFFVRSGQEFHKASRVFGREGLTEPDCLGDIGRTFGGSGSSS